jgi:hypothetical protein
MHSTRVSARQSLGSRSRIFSLDIHPETMERRSRWRVVKDQVGEVWVEALNRIQLFDKSIGNAAFESRSRIFTQVRLGLRLTCVNQSAIEPLLVDFEHRWFVVW